MHHFAVAQRIVKDLAVGVRVQIDKTRGDNQAGNVDFPAGDPAFHFAHRPDLVADQQYIAAIAGAARAINNRPATQNNTVHKIPSFTFVLIKKTGEQKHPWMAGCLCCRISSASCKQSSSL